MIDRLFGADEPIKVGVDQRFKSFCALMDVKSKAFLASDKVVVWCRLMDLQQKMTWLKGLVGYDEGRF